MKIAVFGDGAWGTALAMNLIANGHDVTVWGAFPEYLEEMRSRKENCRFLPGVALPDELAFESDAVTAVRNCDVILLATPTQFLRSVLKKMKGAVAPGRLVVNVAKGIEKDTFLRISEIVKEELGFVTFVDLSGPSHAEEVAQDIPTGLLAASEDRLLAEFVQDAFMSECLRIYTSPDAVGAELGAALKNVIALCAGVTDGLGYGDNTKAMLMTRGLTEIARLGVSLGAQKDTFAGLTGVGDLIVTCTSMHSRNRRAGILIGKGYGAQEAMKEVGAVVEGYYAAKAAWELSQKMGVELPIVRAAYQVLYENVPAAQVVQELLLRSKRAESEDAGWL
jgi:glycerol-3-phosphate dehydrogenase (NAD(P)+)